MNKGNMKSNNRRKEKSPNKGIGKQRKRENVKSRKVKKKSLDRKKKNQRKRGGQKRKHTIDYGKCIMKLKDYASKRYREGNDTLLWSLLLIIIDF